jgi:glycosyltransferase involved in cell wall biosynthesis
MRANRLASAVPAVDAATLPWHILTGEYPPARGGVSDYTYAVAAGLAAAGDEVHVWCPSSNATAVEGRGVEVHAVAGSWSAADLRRLDAELDATRAPRRLLVQWVPHAYGRRSLNVAFCRWVRRRARNGDVVDLMVHEPSLAFGEGSFRQDAAAAVHRLMLALLLSGAERVWVAIPAWVSRLRPWSFGRARRARYAWLPIPSTIPVAPVGAAPSLADRSHLREGRVVVGHFSTYQPDIIAALGALIPELLAALPQVDIELLGRGSDLAAARLRSVAGSDPSRLRAAGELSTIALSRHLQQCDLLMQPYSDGASTRRTTLMAALAHGIPVVTTVGHLSEPFWAESNAVAAVPAGDHAAMSRAVAALVTQQHLRHRIGVEARALYDSRFSLPRVISTLRGGDAPAAAGI